MLCFRCMSNKCFSQVRRRKDPTALQEGYVNVLWFTSCCTRHEKAEKVDKWLKYISSVAMSLTLTILCFCTFSHEVSSRSTATLTMTSHNE